MFYDQLRPVWAEINLDHLTHNIQQARRHIHKGIKLMAVVKADAYGHGAVRVAQLFMENGADCLAVATLSEALQLRESGQDAEILILGYTPPTQFDRVVQHRIIQTIYRVEDAKILDNVAAEQKTKAKVHIKVDTGMRRLGFWPNADSIEAIRAIMDLSNLDVEGIFTHFARADEKKKHSAKKQYARFIEFIQQLKSEDICPPIQHAANSAAIIELPEYHLNMVRAGIMLYGLYPSHQVDKSKIELLPAMSLRARLSHIKQVPKDKGISYGHIFRTQRESTIGTIPIGYADGYSRLLSNRSQALIKGQRVPLVGRICMDQSMIDISGVDGCEVGDIVTLFGKEGSSQISIDEVADLLDTINYEIVCMISRRVPRVYMQNNEVKSIKRYL